MTCDQILDLTNWLLYFRFCTLLDVIIFGRAIAASCPVQNTMLPTAFALIQFTHFRGPFLLKFKAFSVWVRVHTVSAVCESLAFACPDAEIATHGTLKNFVCLLPFCTIGPISLLFSLISIFQRLRVHISLWLSLCDLSLAFANGINQPAVAVRSERHTWQLISLSIRSKYAHYQWDISFLPEKVIKQKIEKKFGIKCETTFVIPSGKI